MSTKQKTKKINIDDERLRFWLSVEKLLQQAEEARRNRDRLLRFLDVDEPKQDQS